MRLWVILLFGFFLSANGAPLTCVRNNITYKDGQTWKEGCFSYKCSDGRMSLQSAGCKISGECKDVGNKWTAGCFEYQCVQENNSIYSKLLKSGCKVSGECKDIGHKWTNGCFQYQCVQENNFVFRKLLKDGCQETGGKCHDVGTKWNNTNTGLCVEYQCHKEKTNRGYSYQTKIVRAECIYNGKCLAVGQSIKLEGKCQTVLCSIKDGVYSTSIEAKCQDSSGNCHPIGSTGFSLTIGGKLYKNCSCSGDSSSISYKCSG